VEHESQSGTQIRAGMIRHLIGPRVNSGRSQIIPAENECSVKLGYHCIGHWGLNSLEVDIRNVGKVVHYQRKAGAVNPSWDFYAHRNTWAHYYGFLNIVKRW
jgi:hypothetical protein